MMIARFTRFAVFGGVALAAGATPVSAEIVHLTTGRTVNVASHRIEGETIVLALRTGGEISMPKSLVSRISPDEVPWVDPYAIKPRKPIEPTGPVEPIVAAGSARADLPPTAYDVLIEKAAKVHDVDVKLVKAVIHVESAYKPRARSHKGAMGLMQLMPATAREYGVRNAYDPAENINAGVKHLKSLLDRFDVRLAVAAYNAGAGAVERFNGIPPYRETRDYVTKVLRLAGLR